MLTIVYIAHGWCKCAQYLMMLTMAKTAHSHSIINYVCTSSKCSQRLKLWLKPGLWIMDWTIDSTQLLQNASKSLFTLFPSLHYKLCSKNQSHLSPRAAWVQVSRVGGAIPHVLELEQCVTRTWHWYLSCSTHFCSGKICWLRPWHTNELWWGISTCTEQVSVANEHMSTCLDELHDM